MTSYILKYETFLYVSMEYPFPDFILLTKKIWEGNAGRPFFDFDPFTANLIEEGRSRE